MLLPIAHDTAIFPNPLRATMIALIRSGLDVAATRSDKLITYNENEICRILLGLI